MSTKRKLFCLSVEQKREICMYHSNHPSKTQQKIAQLFSERFRQPVSRRSVGDIIADKQKWLDCGVSHAAKKLRFGKHAEMESALSLWLSDARSQNAVVTDAVLRAKAKQLGAEFNVTDFQYSNGWLQRFKSRFVSSSQTMCAECAGDDPAVISRGRRQVMEVIKEFDVRDVYNLDETGLFFRMLPDRSLTTSDKAKGTKKLKDHISVMLCCNADGSDKLRPLIIGKVPNPRCFKNFNPYLYCDYYANKKAWMVNGVLDAFLKAFDRRMAREKRNVLLLMDSASSHIVPNNLKNIQCEFLPPTTTSRLQPMEAGIINAYKSHYRRYLLRFHVDAVDAGKSPKVDVSDAIRWTKLSWDEVGSDVIRDCWHHTGIMPTPTETTADTSGADQQHGEAFCRDFATLFERLNIPSALLMTPAEYLAVDDTLPTCELTTDTDKQSEAGDSGEEDEEEEDSESDTARQPARVTDAEAAAAIDTVMRYFEQSELATPDDVEPLSVIHRRLDFMRFASQEQSSITDYFSELCQ